MTIVEFLSVDPQSTCFVGLFTKDGEVNRDPSSGYYRQAIKKSCIIIRSNHIHFGIAFKYAKISWGVVDKAGLYVRNDDAIPVIIFSIPEIVVNPKEGILLGSYKL